MVHLHFQCQIWGRGQKQLGVIRQGEGASHTVQSLTVTPGGGSQWHLAAWTFPGPKQHQHNTSVPFYSGGKAGGGGEGRTLPKLGVAGE